MRLLLVEDEVHMAEALAEILRRERYEVDVRSDGESGLDALLGGIYDVAVLDVMLPKRSGISVAKEARQQGISTPVLMLTAKSELDDMVEGLDSGADDYMTKPFQARELLARLRALCRRSCAASDGKMTAGDLVLDIHTSVLSSRETGQEVRLSEKEYHIMEYLMANYGWIISREQLALKIWGYEHEAEYNNVEVYLSFTRKKLAFIGTPEKIKAVRGLGYELRSSHV